MEMQDKSIPPPEYHPPNNQHEVSFAPQQAYPQVYTQPTPIIVQTSRPVPVIATGGCPSCGYILTFSISVYIFRYFFYILFFNFIFRIGEYLFISKKSKFLLQLKKKVFIIY